MHPAVARVQAALQARGLDGPVLELAASTRTADEAARACGVSVGQIVKSLVFMAGDEPLLVLVSGANQADLDKLAVLAGRPVRRADAAEVRTATGFAIGGVAPTGHPRPLATIIDRDLLRHERLLAAAGTPRTVFALTPDDLGRLTGGRVADVRREDAPRAG
jgi:prolyl-tRNA editing enzyme YbaK/EbsC (Cys-tRNA(Pro) deacylase)